MLSMAVDWDVYLAEYHAANPGITDRLLNRAHDAKGPTPYQRLMDSIPADSSNVLDVACGSAPVVQHLPRGTCYVGVDISANELRAARVHDSDIPVLRADAHMLPFDANSFDTVVCSMALMLMRPLGPALTEVARVLADDGTLAAMFPTIGAPARNQMLAYSALLAGLRTTPKLPHRLTRDVLRTACRGARLTLINYETRRYTLPLESATDATDIVNGLYLPGTDPQRIARANRLLAKVAGSGRSLPLHITHTVAIKETTR